MRKVLAFVLLAGLGVGLLVWTSGGFLGPGSVGDRPAVEVGEEERGSAGMDLPSFDPEAPQTRLLETGEGAGESRPAGMRRVVHLSWTEDDGRGERFEFPHFLQWTLEVENVKPFLDAETGRQGFRYERVRIKLYREPANRAEAEAMRDDPSFRLLELEIDAAGGTGTWNLRGGVPERPVVRLTRSARLRDHVRSLTVLCDDVVVDLDEESAEGVGDVVAEHPACFLRGRGMRLEDGGSRFEILSGADVRVHSNKEARGGRSPLAGGSMRPTRLHAIGGAVVTTLPPTEGKGYRVDVERAVHVEQVDGPTLQADVAQIVVVEAPDPDGRAGEKSYQLRSFIATGDVKVERRQEGGDAPSLLSVFCDRLVHDATARGPGRTLLEGDCRATYRGDFSTAGGPPTRGLVRLSSRRSMALGPPTDEQPGAHLQLTLEGAAVVERTEASGEDAADRVEAERLVLLLGRREGVTPAAGGGMLDADPGDLVAIGFSATGGVRLDGPRVVGSATTIVGVDLHRPEFRLIADGDPHFDVASAAAREGGATGTSGGGGSGGGSGGGAAAGERKDWRLDWLRASGDVAATLRGGNGPMHLEGDALAFDERTGAVLERKAGGSAWLTLPGGGPDERVEARWIGFDPVRGEVTTRGRTVATVRVGGTRTPSRAAPTDRVVVRGGARIQVEGKRAPGVEYRVRIEGGGSIETVGAAGVVDRLRADEIEAGIGEARGAAGSPLFGGSPAAAKTAPAAAVEAAAPAKASTRWTLECDEGIVARLSPGAGGGVGDLRSFQASGGVVAKTDEQRVDGESLAYDAAAGVLTIDGTPAESARLRLGAGDEAPRAWSPSVRVTLRDGKPVQATLAAPSTVVLFRGAGEGGAAGKTERIELRSEGPLELAAQGAETRGRTALQRSERAKAGEPFGDASTLFTPHLVVEADRLLGGGKTEIRRLLARGPGTRFEHGDPAGDGLALLGESITYDAVAQVVHVEGAGGVRVLRKDGPTSAKSFTYDVARKLLDFEKPRIEIGGR